MSGKKAVFVFDEASFVKPPSVSIIQEEVNRLLKKGSERMKKQCGWKA